MTSLWLDRAPQIATDPFQSGARFDVVIVGAGLSGLATALLLARAGRRVAVLESRRIGAGTTGNTTAKLSVLQGSRLQQIAARASRRALEGYLAANLEGQAWMLRYAAEHNIATQRRDAFSYAMTAAGRQTVEKEHAIARSLGLATELSDTAELPFATTGAVKLAEQAQFDPLEVLATFAADLRAHGGLIFDGTRVTGVRSPARATSAQPARSVASGTEHLVEVRTSRSSLWADRVVLATGIPIMDRGMYWARMTPQRSYAAAFRVPGGIPLGQYLSVDSPSRSLRTTPDGDGLGELLLVGGAGHTVGRHGSDSLGGSDPSPAARVEALTAWTLEHWPTAERTHVWSAQDYEPSDGIPFVGWVPFTHHRVAAATGYSKWGMTNAVQAALQLSARLLGGELPWWAEAMRRRPVTAASLLHGVALNLGVAKRYGTGLAHVLTTPVRQATPSVGEAYTGRDGGRLKAVSNVDGRVCAVSPLCSHVGAPLNWNDLEHTWDCPAHGSRFTPDGRRLEGPAQTDLSPR